MRQPFVIALACMWVLPAGACSKSSKSKASSTKTGKQIDARVAVNKPAKKADAGAARFKDPGDPKTAPPAAIVPKYGRGDCSTKYAPRPKRDPNPMCKIDGGTFMMGTSAAEIKKCEALPKRADGSRVGCPTEDEVPQHKVTLTGFLMDQLEVTNAQYVLFLNTVGGHEFCTPTKNTTSACVDVRPYPKWAEITRDKNKQYSSLPGKAQLPVIRVSLDGAIRYCRWVGKRLPTEAQWEYAARHDPKTGKDLVYPWGDRFEPKRAACNEAVCRDGFVQILPADENDPQRLLEQPAPVGTFDGTGGFKDGSSPWGVHDLAGNADERISECYTESFYASCKAGCVDPHLTKDPQGCSPTTRSAGSPDGNEMNLRAANRGSAGGGGFRCVVRVSK